MNVEEAERAVGYVFKDKRLLIKALTLASADQKENNQLLEFFGDALLEFIVSEKLYTGGGTEGGLTECRAGIVSDKALKPVSEKLGLDKFLIRGKRDDHNKKAVPSAYEAVIAAIYLDGGMDAAKSFVLRTLDFSSGRTVNFKGRILELWQSEGQPDPEYTCKDIGTRQKHRYFVSLNVFGRTFTGEADTKKSAEQLAARAALEFYEEGQL